VDAFVLFLAVGPLGVNRKRTGAVNRLISDAVDDGEGVSMEATVLSSLLGRLDGWSGLIRGWPWRDHGCDACSQGRAGYAKFGCHRECLTLCCLRTILPGATPLHFQLPQLNPCPSADLTVSCNDFGIPCLSFNDKNHGLIR